MIICNQIILREQFMLKDIEMILNLAKKRNFAIICDEAYSEFTNKKKFFISKD